MATLTRNVGAAGENENLYQLKWTHYQNYMASGLQTLLEEEDFLTDVTLGSEGQFVQAHKMALALCSPFFKDFFKLNRVRQSNGQCLIVLSNVSFKQLKNIIRFIYYGEVRVKESEVKDFLDAAQVLQIQGLESPPPPDDKASTPNVAPDSLTSTAPSAVRSLRSQNQPSTSGPSAQKRPRLASNPVVVSTSGASSIKISDQSHQNSILETEEPSILIQSTNAPQPQNFDPLCESHLSQEEDIEGEQMISIDSVVKAERIEVSTWRPSDTSMEDSNYDPGDSCADMSSVAIPVNPDEMFQEFEAGPSSAINSARSRAQGTNAKSQKPSSSVGPTWGQCYVCKLRIIEWRRDLCQKGVPKPERTSSRSKCYFCHQFICAKPSCRVNNGSGLRQCLPCSQKH